MQANVSKCIQMQANSSKCKQLQGPPGVNKPSIWKFINAGRAVSNQM
jgi:hypothetical protein